MRLFDFSDKPSTHLGEALSVGTTLTTRFWICLFSLSLAGQILMGQPSLFSHAGMQMFFQLVPAAWWGFGMTLSGVLMGWRICARRSVPWLAWTSNALAFGLWSSIVLIRFVLIGSESLSSSSTVIAMMAGWVLLRTEATSRDQETA